MSGMSRNSSPTWRLASVCRTTPPAPVRNSPAVRFTEPRRTIPETSERVKPLRRKASSLISMVISRSRVPLRSTSETDGSASRSSRSRSAASRNWSSVSTEDETANVITSRTGRDINTSGCSALTGGKFSMRSTAFCTSSSTVSGLAKAETSILTWPSPSVATPTTRSTPGLPMTLSSIRRLMSCSTSSGDVPGEGTRTVTVRWSTSGKPCTANSLPAMAPPMSRTSMRRLAATRFSAK